MENKRLGIVAIFIEKNRESVALVNGILSEFHECIRGRMGLPDTEDEISIISVIVKATTEQLGAMTGRLGNLKGVTVKSMVAK